MKQTLFVGEETLAAWCQRVGIPYSTVYARLSRGWTPEDALQGSRQRQSRFNDPDTWHERARALGFDTVNDDSIYAAILDTYQRTGSSQKTATLFDRGAQTIRTHLHKMGADMNPPGGYWRGKQCEQVAKRN